MRTSHSIAIIICSVLILPCSAGEVVFSQPAVIMQWGATMCDFDPSLDWGNHYQFAADDFILDKACAISEIRWWGIYQKNKPAENVVPPYPYPIPKSNFTIRIFDDVNDKPDNAIVEIKAIGSCNPKEIIENEGGGSTHYFEYHYRFEESISFEGNTRYWLSIVDSTGFLPDDIFFSWIKSESTYWCYSLTPGGLTGWTPYTGSPGMSFELITGTEPCPKADLTGDCFVDLEDLSLLASQWLTGASF